MSDVEPEAVGWVERYAAALGVPMPSDTEMAALLELAATAAHASHRQAAPMACWLAAQAGLTPAEALVRAQELGA